MLQSDHISLMGIEDHRIVVCLQCYDHYEFKNISCGVRL